MVVALRNLRITADMDASGYARGAATIRQSSDQAAQGARAVGAALAQLDAAAEATSGKIAQVSRQFIPGYQAAAQFEVAVRNVGRAMDVGMDPARAATSLQTIYSKFGLVADATVLARQGFVQLAPVVAEVNQSFIAQARSAELAAAAVRRVAEAQAASARIVGGMSAIGGPRLGELQANERLIAGMSASMDRFGASTGHASFMTKQLSFQIFDVAQGIPLIFDSPRYALLNLATQTGQIAQLYQGQGGLKQAFADTAAMAGRLAVGARNVGVSLLGFITTPLGAVSLAATAAGAALGAVAAVVISRLPTTEHALKEHEDAIKRIRDAWTEALHGSQDYQQRAVESVQFLTNRDIRTQKELLDRQLSGALGTGQFTGAGLTQQLSAQLLQNQVSVAWTDQQAAMRAFTPAIEHFLESVNRGKPDLAELNAEIDHTANIHPEVAYQKAASELHGWTKEATDTVDRLKELNGVINNLRIDQAFGVAGQGMTPADQARQNLLFAQRQHAVAIAAIEARSPSEMAAIARARETATPMRADESPDGRRFRIDAAGAIAYAQAIHQITEANRQRAASARDAIGSAQLDIDTIGKSAGEVATLRANWATYTDLRRDAEQNHTAFDNAQYERLKRENGELGKRIQLAAQISLKSDILFDVAQFNRSPVEREVASTLRSAQLTGDTAAEAWIRYRAELQKSVDLMDDARGMSRSFVKDLIEGARTGDIGSAFDKLFESIGGRVEEGISKQITDSLLGPQGAVGSGPIGSVLQSIFGPTSPANLSASATATMNVNAAVVNVGGAGIGNLLSAPLGAVTGRDLGFGGPAIGSFRAAQDIGLQGRGGAGNAILDLIAKREGTGSNYNETLAYGALTGGPRNLTGMSLNEIDRLQTSMLGSPSNRWNSSAVGRYQITRTTMRDLRQQLGLTGDERYDPAMQDRMGMSLYKQRGFQPWEGMKGAGQDEILKAQQEFAASADRFSGQFDTTLTNLASNVGQTGNQFSNSFMSALQNVMSGLGSSLSSGALSAIASSGGNWLVANGGYISGPGSGTSDSIPARLSNGEFVMNARSTQRFRPQLEAMNRGFAAGGHVQSAPKTEVHIHDSPGDGPMRAKETRTPDGGTRIDVMRDSFVGGALASNKVRRGAGLPLGITRR